MKIYYLSGARIPSRSANSVQVMKMCRAFAKRGNNVVLFSRQQLQMAEDPFEYYGVEPCFKLETCHRPAIRGWGAVKYAWNVSERAKQRGLPDLFYARYVYTLAAVAGFGLPMIFEAHAIPRNWIERHIEKWLFARPSFKRLVVISDALRQDYLRIFPWLSEDQIHVAHDGADLPVQLCERVRIRWPGRDGCLQVGYVGHLYPGKGMEIIAPLAERMADVDFHVVGGREGDLAYWKARASLPNLFYHGFVPHGKLGAYYDRFDLALAPLQNRVALEDGKGDIARWTSPMKIFEYMAYGKTIVASDLAVLQEVLSHNENALIVGARDLDSWVEAIQRLIASPNLRESLSLAAKQTFIDSYTWEKRASSIIAECFSSHASKGL